MNKFVDDKQKKINNIVNWVKLSSLLVSSIIFFKGIFAEEGLDQLGDMITAMIFIFAVIYGLWALWITRKKRYKNALVNDYLETAVFIAMFLSVIMQSKGAESNFKFLFIFIIITTTMQSGLQRGTLVACISSLIILTVDLLHLPGADYNPYFENDLFLCGLFVLTAWPLGHYVRLEQEHIAELERLVNEDGLTGVYNHRYFYESLKLKIALCEKEHKPISMIFIDIDYFKYYNDLYGHQKGDEVLKKLAGLLKDNVRNEDIVARYGGEEFAILLPDTSEQEAMMAAEGIRDCVEKTYFEGQENQPNKTMTVSVGVSTYPDKARNEMELVKSADDALYRAKFFNKNRVEAYTSILDELKNDIEEEHIDLVTSIKTLISVINAKDKYTYGHVERVVMYCRMLAERLGLGEEEKKNLIYGAYMHDIGKINIAKEILNKRMPLSKDEWEILKQHSQNGVDIIKPVQSLKEVSPLILYHHERYDGAGYPHNLKGKEIPYLARILTVADCFDAMTSNRPYNRRKTYEEAAEELKKCSGTQFDPEIIQVFTELIQNDKISFDNILPKELSTGDSELIEKINHI